MPWQRAGAAGQRDQLLQVPGEHVHAGGDELSRAGGQVRARGVQLPQVLRR